MVVFITRWGVGIFEASASDRLAVEGSRWSPTPRPDSKSQPGASFSSGWRSVKGILPSLLTLTGEGVVIHFLPRLELFVRPRDGTGGGPSTQAKTRRQVNHAKT